jgi:hypothetical protein
MLELVILMELENVNNVIATAAQIQEFSIPETGGQVIRTLLTKVELNDNKQPLLILLL